MPKIGEEAVRIYDISAPLSGATPVYPGDVGLELTDHAEIGEEGYRVTRMKLSSHTGTHLDAPSHFIPGGSCIDEASPLVTCGTTLVAEVFSTSIDFGALEGVDFAGCERLLLKTPGAPVRCGNPSEWPHLTLDGARRIAASGIRLVGIDSISIEEIEGCGDVHRELLGAGILILETIDLSEVPPGRYEMICLPLRLEGGDGAPARAFLLAAE